MRDTVKLSEWQADDTFKGWKKFIFGRRFYFSAADGRASAERQALALMQAANDLESKGEAAWTAEAIQTALAPFKAEKDTTTPPTPSGRTSVRTSGTSGKGKGLTFRAALDEYKAKVLADPSLSGAWRAELPTRAERLKQSLPDLPLSGIGYDELNTLVAYWAGLHMSDHTGKRVSTDTAMNQIHAARQFFLWLSDSGRWEECRRFERIFQIKRSAVERNDQRRKPNLIQTFTTEELHRLWQRANDRQRLAVGLGLFCGWTQTEIATATPDMFHLNAAQPYVERDRNKTGVYGKWVIPAELASLVRQFLSPKGDVAFRSRKGNPLVWFTPKGLKVDSIGQSFDKLQPVAAVSLSFKYLRKTGSDAVRKAAGLELSQAFLAHSGKSVAERNYNNADFDRLQTVLSQWHKELMPVLLVPMPKRKINYPKNRKAAVKKAA